MSDGVRRSVIEDRPDPESRSLRVPSVEHPSSGERSSARPRPSRIPVAVASPQTPRLEVGAIGSGISADSGGVAVSPAQLPFERLSAGSDEWFVRHRSHPGASTQADTVGFLFVITLSARTASSRIARRRRTRSPRVPLRFLWNVAIDRRVVDLDEQDRTEALEDASSAAEDCRGVPSTSILIASGTGQFGSSRPTCSSGPFRSRGPACRASGSGLVARRSLIHPSGSHSRGRTPSSGFDER